MNNEVWKDIEGYEGFYQVSNKGRIKGLKKWNLGKCIFENQEYFIKGWINRGYHSVSLTKNKKHKNYYVHRLVAMAFIDNLDNKPFINHIDFNPLNNTVENLEWCTQKENVNHSICNMMKRRSITHSNTNEKYISFRRSTGTYRITIDKKEIGSALNLESAIEIRDAYLGV